MRSTVVSACLGVCLAAAAPLAAAGEDYEPVREGTVSVAAAYSSSVLIFKVGEIVLDAEFSEHRYRADSFVEAAGLAALFTDFDIRAEVHGTRGGGGQEPARYGHVERTGDKVRAVDVDLTGEVAVSVAEPPFGSLGQPPASASDRRDVLDPMTAFFELSDLVRETGGQRCEGRLRVFDGKARYDLRIEDGGRESIRTRAWRGEAVVCRAFYEPISGYDPEDYPSESELRHPLVIWLAEFPEAGIYMPVRLHTRAGFGGVTVEAVRLAVDPATNS